MGIVIDVVIPTYRPDGRLLKILDRMTRQSVPPRYVRLVNTDRSVLDALLKEEGLTEEELGARYPFVRITHIRREEFDHGGTRNLGFRLCAGADYVLTMTQDALPVDDALIGRLLQAMRSPGTLDSDAQGDPDGARSSGDDPAGEESSPGEQNMTDALSGEEGAAPKGTIAVAYARQLPNADAPFEERLSRYYNYPDASRVKSEADRTELGIKTYYCSNVCAMYRMDIWRTLGGFPDRAIFNEDMIYACRALRAGYRTYYAASAKVYHSHIYTAAQQFHRNFDLGVSQAQNPDVFGGLSSEGEGVTYVKAVVRQMLSEHAALQVPGFALRCAARLAGYRLGRAYERLPRRWVIRFSSNKAYWAE